MKKFSLIILLALILVGCREPVTESNYIEINKNELSTITPSVGGQIIIPLINYETLNPLKPNNTSTYYFSKLIYDSLFSYSDDGTLESNLVEHYVLSPDQMSLTLTLKDNISWHDGKKLTTNDVIHSFNLIKSMEEPNPYLENFKNAAGIVSEFDINKSVKMSVFDERNIDILFDKPYRNYLDMFTFPIMPSHLDTGKTIDGTFLPMGSGPYEIKEILPGKNVILQRNETYHGRLPYILEINGKIFDSSDLAFLAFETGQINIVSASGYDWSKYADSTRIRVEEYNTNELDYLYLNSHSSIFSGENGRAIKKAIARAINKKRIIDRVYLGKAIETSIPLNINKMNEFGLRSDTYYNLDIAKELLAGIGYVDTNSDGLLEDENGDRINIELKTNYSNPQKRLSAEFIAQDLREIGINVIMNYDTDELNSMSFSEREAEYSKFLSDISSGNYQLALVSVNLTESPDIGSILHSTSIGSGINYSNYSSIEMDNLIQNLSLNNSNEDVRNLYLSVIELLDKDNPIIPLYVKKSSLLVDSDIQGNVNPLSWDLYRSFRNVFILKQFQ